MNMGGLVGYYYSTELHGTTYSGILFNTLFSGTEQFFNISLHVNSSCFGLWNDVYSLSQICERINMNDSYGY